MGSSRTRARTCVPCIGRQILNHCATREVHTRTFKSVDLNNILGVFIEDPPVCSVSSKAKRFLNLFPGASWEGRKVESCREMSSSASPRDCGEGRGAGLGDDTRGTSGTCFKENREEEQSRLN